MWKVAAIIVLCIVGLCFALWSLYLPRSRDLKPWGMVALIFADLLFWIMLLILWSYWP